MKAIAIITGGSGKEREISINSAKNIEKEISKSYDVDTFLFPEQWDIFIKKAKNYEVVMPIIHGAGGEDGFVQNEMDKLCVRYLFSKPSSHIIAFDKPKCSDLISRKGLRCPRIYRSEDEMSFPVVIKTKNEGSSLGVIVVNKKSDLPETNESKMIEEYISGRKFTVGVIEENKRTRSLPVLEIKRKNIFLTFEEKYSKDNAQVEICPAEISSDLDKKLKEVALRVHTLLGLRHISRSDFIVDSKGYVYFLEVNTIPGMTEASLIIKQLKAVNLILGQLIVDWVENL
ncbi:MAG: D-alanine-D-alanine ligase [Candidatus Paceibacteria bacterium]|jgi:D-alanine-D-alanine ligase